MFLIFEQKKYLEVAGKKIRKGYIELLVLIVAGVIGGLVAKFTGNKWFAVGIVVIFLLACKFVVEKNTSSMHHDDET
jgi:uncharacterized membrane protein YjjP (DUF1212 family)